MTMSDWMVGTLGLVLLVLPGWLLARGLRVPHPLLAGFIASVVAMVWLILVLDLLSVRLTFGHCGGIWVGATLVMAWWARRKLRSGPSEKSGPRFPWANNWPLLFPLLPIVGVVVYRAGAQSLFGIDTIFRWNYLAEQMLARGSIAFYPPVNAADYEIYSWPDGIAPAVSAPYFWLYALAGVARPGLTAPLVLLQFGLIVVAGFALARRLFSDRAAAFSMALIACSPTIGWATAMGQEPGLTTLSFAAVLLYLPKSRTEETTGTLVCAGLAAGLGMLAREYGLALVLLGLAVMAARRLSGRAIVAFSLGAATALPWYFRNWARTGNPVFNLDVSGWFPINQEHAWLMESYETQFGWSNVPAGAAAYVLRNCWMILLAGMAGAVVHFRQSRALIVGSGAVVLLWAASVGYTAAGFTNALRVLSPALLLLAVIGGGLAARLIPARRYLGGVAIALTLLVWAAVSSDTYQIRLERRCPLSSEARSPQRYVS